MIPAPLRAGRASYRLRPTVRLLPVCVLPLRPSLLHPDPDTDVGTTFPSPRPCHARFRRVPVVVRAVGLQDVRDLVGLLRAVRSPLDHGENGCQDSDSSYVFGAGIRGIQRCPMPRLSLRPPRQTQIRSPVSETQTTTAPRPLLLADGRPAVEAWSLDPALRHLNHGSFGAVPVVAQERQSLLRAEMERSPVVWFPELPRRIAAARADIAGFLRVDSGDLALVPNASAGASTVYASLDHRPGGEIVVTDHGYGAVTMGAERLARRWGGRVRTARVPLDADEEQAYEAVVAEFGDATALVVLDHITSATARRMPVGRIGAEARRRGIPLLVDGAHAPGLIAAPLDGVDCDFWVGNLHKWGCAPRGTAALVARGPLRERLYPLIDSWAAAEPFPDRFDQQGTLDSTGYLAAPAALDLVERMWGWDTARAYMDELAGYGERVVRAAFAERTGDGSEGDGSEGVGSAVDVGMPVPGMRLVRLPDGLGRTRIEADALRDRAPGELGVEAAFTSFGGVGYLRLSAHVYNTPADYEYFAEACVPVLCEWARAARDGDRYGAA